MHLMYHHRIPCSIDNHYNDQQINLKRMKQIIFSNHIKFNQKYHYTKQHTHFDNKWRKNKSIPIKKFHKISQRRFLPKTHQSTLINPSINSISSQNTNIRNHINVPINIISHTHFGKSMLALYFQKYRFISPINNNKKDQFLQFLKNICHFPN
jgi:hypothetical protein